MSTGNMNKYSSRWPELEDSLRKLTKKNVLFLWSLEHAEAFEAIKKEMTSSPIFKYYDASKSLTLQIDTSLKGHGAVLIQEDHLTCFVSKSL